jgi:uncharacterized membrane protein YdbT with pleckstrin-like domain
MPEETIYKGTPSAALRFGIFALSVLSILLMGTALVMFWDRIQPPPMRYILGAMAFIPLLVALSQYALLKTRLYEITSERIKITTGIFSKRTEELELYRVKDATLVEPFVLRLFSAGNIEIATADASAPVVLLEGVKNARDLREQLRKNVEACRDKKRTRVTELE